MTTTTSNPPISESRDSASRALVSSLMRPRKLAAILAIAGIAQITVTAFGLPGLMCPLLRVVGIPCPGCGASRACVAMIHGHVGESIHRHAFAPAFLMAIALMAIAAILPLAARGRLIDAVERIERSTSITRLALAALVIYWLARLLYAPLTFARFMAE